MQEAYDSRDGNIYSALQVEKVPYLQNELSGVLRCGFCHERAYYRSRSENGRVSPCFFCRPHGESCEITRQDADPWGDDDEGRIDNAARNGGKLLVKIMDGAGLDDGPISNVALAADDSRTRSGSRIAQDQSNNIQRGPQRILELLVGSPRFRTSSMLVKFKDGSELPANQAFVSFQQANHALHTGKWLGFWGQLTHPSRWEYGSSNYFNFGAEASDFRISLSDVQLGEILRRYGLSSINDLAGGWFILFDVARITNSNRFTAEVISLNHVGFMRP